LKGVERRVWVRYVRSQRGHRQSYQVEVGQLMRQRFTAIAYMIVIGAALGPNQVAQAKNSCVAIYKQYARWHFQHKAFATTGGVAVGSPYPYACGFAQGAMLVTTRHVALQKCTSYRNRNYDSRKCAIIDSK
jgi:hypothetical protein